MLPEERNRVMDEVIETFYQPHFGPRFPNHLEAIRESYRLARAWDALLERINERIAGDKTGFNSAIHYFTLKELMASLLSPKDPLEELEQKAIEMACFVPDVLDNELIRKVVYLGPLLAEIRRLRERGKK